MKRRVMSATFLVILAVIPGWALQPAFAEQELIISAAASLTNAFSEVGKAFEKRHPRTKVTFNFAASGALLQQIDQGAPVDVFASADQETMDQAAAKKLILPGTRKDFAANDLVLILPKGGKSPIKGLKDLAIDEVKRIGLGNPQTVPAGRYAKRALLAGGVWENLQPKLIFGENVRQVLDYVKRGEVDAGFVFATDSMAARENVRTVATLEIDTPICYPLAVVGTAKAKESAEKFIQFVLSEEGQEILARYGFKKL